MVIKRVDNVWNWRFICSSQLIHLLLCNLICKFDNTCNDQTNKSCPCLAHSHWWISNLMPQSLSTTPTVIPLLRSIVDLHSMNLFCMACCFMKHYVWTRLFQLFSDLLYAHLRSGQVVPNEDATNTHTHPVCLFVYFSWISRTKRNPGEVIYTTDQLWFVHCYGFSVNCSRIFFPRENE